VLGYFHSSPIGDWDLDIPTLAPHQCINHPTESQVLLKGQINYPITDFPNYQIHSVVGTDLRHAKFLVFVLQLIELPVNPAFGQQCLVVPDLAHLAFVHHDDIVRPLNG
jgi:hypothetical protein